MIGYFSDLIIVSLLILTLTSLLGVILNSFGVKFFGGKKKSEFVDQSAFMQTGWKSVGGKRK